MAPPHSPPGTGGGARDGHLLDRPLPVRTLVGEDARRHHHDDGLPRRPRLPRRSVAVDAPRAAADHGSRRSLDRRRSVVTLRIVHVSAYCAPAFVYGGPPRSIFELCRAQRELGASVHVITTSANGDRELPQDVIARGEYEGIPVRYCE